MKPDTMLKAISDRAGCEGAKDNFYIFMRKTGLDSNKRKNRGGHQMENFAAKYQREITSSTLGLPKGFATNKRWDFVIRTVNHLYVIETNFYTSGGSKLNETARSYRLIAEEAGKIKNFV